MSIRAVELDRIKLVANIASMVPLDIRDSKTGESRSSGCWLNSYCYIAISVDQKYNSITGEYENIKLKEIHLHLREGEGRKDRKYKISDSGVVSDRFWKSIREHTKSKLSIKMREDNKSKRIKDNAYKVEAYNNGILGVSINTYSLKQMRAGTSNEATISAEDGSLRAHFEVDCNGDIKLSSLQVYNRYITPDTFKAFVELFGTKTVRTKVVPANNGELFDV